MPFDADPKAAKTLLPFVGPLALEIRRTPFDSPDWLFELKHDGFRGVLYVERGRGAQLVSRRGLSFANQPFMFDK